MPQLVVAALLGAGLYAGYRWVARAARQALEETERVFEERGTEAKVTKDLGALEFDAAAGVYRPKKRG